VSAGVGSLPGLRIRRPSLATWWGAGAFLTSLVVAWIAGATFDDTGIPSFWQYLDVALLKGDLLRSLYYLHAQPPLFNLFLGLVLKLGAPWATWAFALSVGGAGLLLLLTMAWFFDDQAVRPAIYVPLLFLFALHPTFIMHTHWVFYTLPCSLYLVGSALCLARFVKTQRRIYLVIYAALLTILVLTRAVYHEAWVILAGASTAIVAPAGLRRALLVAVVPALVAFNLWALKCYAQVGVYGTSSWMGMNAARGWEEVVPRDTLVQLAQDGRLPPLMAIKPFGWREDARRAYEKLGAFHNPGSRYVHPAIDDAFKRDGFPNLNHRDYAWLSQQYWTGVVALVRRYPAEFLRKTLKATALYLQPGPNANIASLPFDARFLRYRDAMNFALFGAGKADASFNLLFLLYPLVLAGGAFLAWARGGLGPAFRSLRPALTFMLVSMVFVLLASTLFEYAENDRMRVETDGLAVMLLGLVVHEATNRLLLRRRGAGALHGLFLSKSAG